MSLWSRAFLLPLVAASAAAWGQSRITAVDITPVEDGLDVSIVGTALAKPKELRLMNGSSYIAEFDARLDIKGFRRRMSSGGVNAVEVGWFSARPPKVRIHLRIEAALAPIIVQDGDKWTIKVRKSALIPQGTASNPLPPTRGGSGGDSFPTSVPPLNLIPQPQPAGPSGASSGLKPEDKTVAPPAGGAAVQPTANPKPDQAKPAPSRLPAAAPAARPAPAEKRVNVEFVGADVVQVLRGLSQEAGVNIVTAPDVSPADKPSRITVSLRQVTVGEALTYVTVIANLRYAKLNNTFFVTKSENFASTMREFYKGDAGRFATRVVSVPSGEGIQIRNALLAAYPQDGEGGFYDILDPDATGFAAPEKAAETPAAGAGAAAKPPVNPNLPVWLGGDPMGLANAQQKQATKARVSFLMLVGDPRKLDLIEGAARDLDQKISSSFSLSRTEDTGAEAVPILGGQTKQIKEMMEKILEANPRRNAFTFSESSLRELSEGDLSTNVILMIGPKADLALLKSYAQSLDENLCRTAGIAYSRDPNDLEKVYEVVELRYVEPLFAAFDLKNRIRGLYVTTVPDSVTPSLKGEQKDEKQDETRAPGQTGDNAPPAATPKKEELNRGVGREPMRLIMRGTRQQVEEAKQYLALVDIPPRQAAFEIRVVDMTREEAIAWGIDWSLLTSGMPSPLRINQGTARTSSNAGTIGGALSPKQDVYNFLATLDKADDGRRILARPNALLSDARPWNLFVGDTIRYVESIQSTQNGVTISIGTVEVGVTTNLLGRFGGDGSIALDVEQKFSILNSFTAVPGGGQIPQTSDRTLRTTLNMKAGEVMAIGGLIQETKRKSVSGIPLLMDLPILGQLFKRTTDSKVRTELVFIIAAVEVSPANRPNAASPRNSEIGTPDPEKLYKNNEIRNGKP